MSQDILEVDQLLIRCRAGRGHIVIVEGQSEDDDPWFYQQWFGDRGPVISFFAQNGWHRVRRAVEHLRAALPHRSVHGIRDRDFTPQPTVDAQLAAPPSDGIWYTPRFTLENELLDPAGWAAVAHALGRGRLDAWRPAEAEQRVAEAYALCLPVAAYNRVLYDERLRQPHAFDRKDIRHPSGALDAEQTLRAWGIERGAPDDLGDRFRSHIDRLRDTPLPERARQVTGKAVVRLLARMLNDALPKRNVPVEHLIALYLDKHPYPSPELTRLIDAILATP